MLGKDIAGALGGIPDEKIMDAMNVYKRKQRSRNILFRAAAVAATLAIILTAALWPRRNADGIVTAPGVLKVYAYDLSSGTAFENMVSYELGESIIKETRDYTWVMNSLYGLPLTLEVTDDTLADMNISFEVLVDHGSFYGDIHNEKYWNDQEDLVASIDDVAFGQRFTVENGETVFWSTRALHDEAIEAGMHPYEYMEIIDNVINVEIVVRADEHIVGYALVKIHYEDGFFAATLNKSVCFPQVNGEFQEIMADKLQEYMHEE